MKKTLLSLVAASMMLPAFAVTENKGVNVTNGQGSNWTGVSRSVNVPFSATGYEFTPNQYGQLNPPAEASYSIGMWVNPTGLRYVNAPNDKGAIMAYGNTGDNTHFNIGSCHWGIYLDTSYNGYFVNQANAYGNTGADGLELGAIAKSTWHYILVSIDNVGLKLAVYVDGEKKIDTDLESKILPDGNRGSFHFGHFGAQSTFDEIQFFKKPLNDAEAAQAYVNAANVDGVNAIYTLNSIKADSTGKFANEMLAGGAGDATYLTHNFGGYWGDGALVNWASATETAPTLVDGRTGYEAQPITVNVVSANGGTFTVMNGETALSAGSNTLTSTDVVNVVATPADGYLLAGITAITAAGEANVLSGSDVVLLGNTTLKAEFSNSFSTLTVKNDKEIPYTITFLGEEVTDLTKIISGKEYQLTIDLPYEYVLDAIKIGDKELEAVNGVYTFSVDGNATLTIAASDKPQHIVSLYVAKINDQTPGAVVVTDQFGKEYSYQYQYIYEVTVLTLSNTHNEGYAFLHYMIGDGETMEPFVGKTITVTGGMVIEGVFEEGPTYPEMSRTFTNGVNQQNRYIKSVEVTGTQADGFIYNAETDADLGREDFPVAKGEYSTVGAVINKTGVRAKPITIDAGTEQFTFQFLPWTEPITTADGLTCTTEIGWTNMAYYVDWNRDGDFIDEGEYFTRDQNGMSNDKYTISTNNTKVVTVPAGITPGKYRMRFIFSEDDADWTTSIFENCQMRNGVAYDFDIVVEGAELENARTVTIAANYDEAGSVAIVKVPDVEEGATQVTTKWKYVSMEATPKGDAQLVNWVDKDGVQMTTESVYTYTGTEDAEFIANFGYAVNYNSDANGTLSVTLGSVAVASGQYVAYGDEVTVTPVAQPGYVLKSLTVNDQPVELTDGAYTFTLEATTNIVAEFAERTYTLSMNVVSGNGKIIVGSNADDNGLADAEFENGAVITDDIAWFAAAVADAGEFVCAVEYIIGDEAPVRVFTEKDELPVYSDEVTEWAVDNGVGFFLEASKNDVIINAWFSTDGNPSAIEGVDADNAEGVVEYYNLQGVKVAAENLAPGFYIARQGNKVAKILINK